MKDINVKLVFGSIIVIILLGLYGYSLLEAINLAKSVPKEGETLAELNPGVSRTLATVGGLVSALVIAELAITKPGKSIGARLFVSSDPNAPAPRTPNWVAWISAVYVLVWILLGVAAFYYGELRFPNKVPALTDFAQAWLGLAVAAAYSYFGIRH